MRPIYSLMLGFIVLLLTQAPVFASVLFPEDKTTFYLDSGEVLKDYAIVDTKWGKDYRSGWSVRQQLKNMFRRAMAGGETLTLQSPSGETRKISYSDISKQSTSKANSKAQYTVIPFMGPVVENAWRVDVDYDKLIVVFEDASNNKHQFEFKEIEYIDYANGSGHAFNGSLTLSQNGTIIQANRAAAAAASSGIARSAAQTGTSTYRPTPSLYRPSYSSGYGTYGSRFGR